MVDKLNVIDMTLSVNRSDITGAKKNIYVLFGTKVELKAELDGALLGMIQQKGYLVARHVVPSVLWTYDDSPKGLQLPHVDFDKVLGPFIMFCHKNRKDH